ncbi:SMI1/KNR4 family protein [Pedobacter sp. KBW06]|uniref:SMI1/KNR4 family protein n=1 Tax=Pedobacter sp. KBW06 TaxID=2153359 RepID=UPI000F593D97|nr:SMI1/KNR4 family protein [Pedobacter sp. KBW06]RQO68073.1 SMI1/KNR4 family protein [Pedobacter sp. KBW06]
MSSTLFVKKRIEELLHFLKIRKSKIENTDEVPISDLHYLCYISTYEGLEITPDIELFGYEKALKENRYIEENYSDLYSSLWMIGSSGQGDGWFLDRTSGCVLFYDHDQGEYDAKSDFLSLQINFPEFIQAAFLFQEFESLLDEGYPEAATAQLLKVGLDAINPVIFDLYPYKY